MTGVPTLPEWGFELIYEEGPCFAVLKPGGVLTQGPPGVDSIELRFKRFLKAREGKAGNVYLGVPHRLDRPVSGVLLLARHVRAARRLAEQFEGRTVRKTYWAIVEGRVSPSEGVWSDFHRKTPGEPKAELVPEDHPEGKPAVLRYRVLHCEARRSWLEIELETGRTHQIRVQAAARGHPILGDALYGATSLFGPETVDERQRWIALHARFIAFKHPMTREPVSVTAPLLPPWSGVAPPGAG
ncbi:MAG: RNA pseudouridine synthase [Planctomycetes bacterium]|nr:RNA pseudouridine synthase [Planctomycetota bacterium]